MSGIKRNKKLSYRRGTARCVVSVEILPIIIIIILAHQHKAAGKKTRLDIQNYGCNGNLLC